MILTAFARSPRGRLLLESGFELLLIVAFLKAYNLTRNLFGSNACSPQFALGHAQQIVLLEQLLGIYWEQQIQGAVLQFPSWIRFWNIFYGSAHMAVTVFVLVFLFVLKPQAYQRCRTTFLLMNLFAIVVYAAYPLMPPRLMNACDDKYGACLKDYAYVDTLYEYGGLWSWRHKRIAKVTNHYAAMPSMHAGYSLWCSMSMYEHSPFLAFRVLGVVYPFLNLYCIVVTANHFFLDAALGVMLYYAALKLAPRMPKFGRGAGEALPALGTTAPGAEEDSLLPVTLADLAHSHDKQMV